MVSSLVDMGFAREQVERRMADLEPNTRPDIATMIMLMAGDSAEHQGTEPPAVPEVTPAPETPGLKAKSTLEFQALVKDMLQAGT